MKSVVIVESIRETPGAPPTAAPKIEREVRFYITSLLWMADLMGPVIGGHWAVANSGTG